MQHAYSTPVGPADPKPEFPTGTFTADARYTAANARWKRMSASERDAAMDAHGDDESAVEALALTLCAACRGEGGWYEPTGLWHFDCDECEGTGVEP